MFEVDFGNHILILEVFLYNWKLLNCWTPGFTPRFLVVSVLLIFLVFCCIFILFVFILCLVPDVAGVSRLSILDMPLQFSLNVYLTSSKQYFSYIHDKNELTVYKQYIMQVHVHWWHYIYIITLCPMIHVSLDCLFLIYPFGFSFLYRIFAVVLW